MSDDTNDSKRSEFSETWKAVDGRLESKISTQVREYQYIDCGGNRWPLKISNPIAGADSCVMLKFAVILDPTKPGANMEYLSEPCGPSHFNITINEEVAKRLYAALKVVFEGDEADAPYLKRIK